MDIDEKNANNSIEGVRSENPSDWWKPGIMVFVKVSTAIALPIIVALFVGKYLDTKFGTTPWMFLGLTFIAFGVSLFSIWKTIKGYLSKLKNEKK